MYHHQQPPNPLDSTTSNCQQHFPNHSHHHTHTLTIILNLHQSNILRKEKQTKKTHSQQSSKPKNRNFSSNPKIAHRHAVDLSLYCRSNQTELNKAKPISKVPIFDPTHHTKHHPRHEISHLSFPSSNQTHNLN